MLIYAFMEIPFLPLFFLIPPEGGDCAIYLLCKVPGNVTLILSLSKCTGHGWLTSKEAKRVFRILAVTAN